ncbi:MAG: hypothetical protein IKT89_06595 [Clostridia bacterium]|nr:hypothetical protein [Clostridia bacterium]
MRKLLVFLLVIFCVLGTIGCNKQPQEEIESQPQQKQENQLLPEGNVIKVNVSSLPEKYNYSFTGENVKVITDYLSSLNLQSNFEENPDDYFGMTWVISLEYENGDTLTIYHFGNMFIRSEQGSCWYRMTSEEASRFESLLNELDN